MTHLKGYTIIFFKITKQTNTSIIKPCKLSVYTFIKQPLNDAFTINATSISSLLTQLNKDWLSDDIIDAYFHLLNLKYIHTKAITTQLFTTLTKTVKSFDNFDYDYQTVKRWFKNCSLFDYHQLLIPINDPHRHWFLIKVDLLEKTIEYYDSMDLYSNNKIKQVCLIIKKFINDEFLFKVCKQGKGNSSNFDLIRKWNMKMIIKIPKQTDSNSCGLFVCYYATRLCDGKITRSKEYNECQDDFRNFIRLIFTQEYRKCLNHNLTTP